MGVAGAVFLCLLILVGGYKIGWWLGGKFKKK